MVWPAKGTLNVVSLKNGMQKKDTTQHGGIFIAGEGGERE